MGSGEPDSDIKMELDDSGCVQDESPPIQPVAEENGYVGHANLLDLSDDVLLYILRYCSPYDLKALGYSCPRLGSLVLERSLWSRVDGRDVYSGRGRVQWLLDHALHAGTQELKLTGFARHADGCQGHVNRTRLEAVEDSKHWREGDHSSSDGFLSEHEGDESGPHRRRGTPRHEPSNPLLHLPRVSSSPCWPDSDSDESDGESEPAERCDGPVFTLGRRLLKRLRLQCPHLTVLYLEYCNINCNKTPLSSFPPTLKRLSLKGTRCFNLPLDKSYLFKIHDYLPVLESLEVSYCLWLEPATLLPLSKLPRLAVLRMRHCPNMHEFVAYVSLATRYGFRSLQVLDFRGSPVGDSEVAALGWLPELRELYLAAPVQPAPASPPAHRHYRGDPRTRRPPSPACLAWERQVPDYYAQSRYQENPDTSNTSQESAHTSVTFAPKSLNIFLDLECDENVERKRKTENGHMDQEAGPSKRPKESDIDKAITNIKNSKTSVTRNNGFVTFRRTIFNNVTDINRRLNSDSDDDNQNCKEDEQETPKKEDNKTPEKEENQSPEKEENENKESLQTSENRITNRVNIDVVIEGGDSAFSSRVFDIDVDRGASTSRYNIRLTNTSESRDQSSSNKPEQKLEDNAEDVVEMEADNGEPPAKKIRLESDPDYQNKFEKMSTDESSSDGNSENMEVNGAQPNNEHLNRSFGSSFEGQSSQGSSYTDTSDPNVSSCSNSQGERSTLTGQRSSVECPSHSNSNQSSIASRLSRLRQSVGLEASPPTQTPEQLGSSRSKQGKSSRQNRSKKLKSDRSSGSNQVGSSGPSGSNREGSSRPNESDQEGSNRPSGSNQVGSSPAEEMNRARIPAPSMEGPSRAPVVRDRNPTQYVRVRRDQHGNPEGVVFEPARLQPAHLEEQAEPRHHVLYVNLGQQLHAVYRLLPSRPMFHSRSRSLSTERLDSSSFVTDSSIRRFGRADGEDVNIVNIGPNGPQFGGRDTSGRPNRSNLRILSATGYRNITNRSLVHLATAAPFLQFIDFTNTAVTENGVEHFRGLRPDCEVIFSEFKEQSDEE